MPSKPKLEAAGPPGAAAVANPATAEATRMTRARRARRAGTKRIELNYSTFSPLRGRPYNRLVKLADAQAIVDFVVREASGPVSVFVADSHGELVAAATMDGAAPDTRLNAQRKAYTAARSDATSTRELGQKARADPAELASFDPFFSFFLGGVAVFDGERRIGAVGVSGLPGDVDEQLALAAIEHSAPAAA